MRAPATLYDKLWRSHVVAELGGDKALIYIDRHLVQEVSSPQAFEGLDRRRMPLRRPLAHLATPDHAVATDRTAPNPAESLAAMQVARLAANAGRHGVPFLGEGHPAHGIVHVIGPETGFTLPGCTLVCGDSHTSTHGAFGALAFGIGASECETVFAAQCLPQTRLQTMRIEIDGQMPQGVESKDVALALVARIGTDGARGHAVEYSGAAVRAMSMEARMTLCNLTIEAGGRIGLIAPDQTTFAYLESRALSPHDGMWARAVEAWKQLHSDEGASFDRELAIDARDIAPQVSWGTNPAQTCAIGDTVPDPAQYADVSVRGKIAQSLVYMDLAPGQAIAGVAINRVFIGSCTNSRIEDLRSAARIAAGRRVARGVSAMVVPGSAAVSAAAVAEGLDRIFIDAGFAWRSPGCSMCVAMNADRLAPHERCASTSNRNFEGRQGPGGRTHLMSPAMAAAAAVSGRIVDVRTLASACA